MKCFVYMEGKYQWKEVDKNKENNLGNRVYFTDDTSILMKDVIKVKNSLHKKYVTCAHCGKLVMRDKFEAHCQSEEKKAKCELCEFKRFSSEERLKEKYIKQPDGRYKKVVVDMVKISCGSGYYGSRDCEQCKSNGTCMYYKHRYYGAKNIMMTNLYQYPKMVETIPTINSLSKDWTFVGKGSNYIYYRYKKTKVYAYFNERGFFKYFYYDSNRAANKKFIYSPAYDKFFAYNREKSEIDLPVAGNVYKNVYKMITKMYEV